ncbi:cupredoxin domain-containing protein [Euzebya tangerina]|uniref:cupredoxin domain-containing protein n=1 Tax=Euzebya tangerina TaxID=591198 RepID=UPI000E30D278|nr:cupredoxin domain-containing protein [Euzebya tangerina]
MRSTITPTLAICLIAGIAAGIALARPARTVAVATDVAGVVTQAPDPVAADPAYGAGGQAVTPPPPGAPGEAPAATQQAAPPPAAPTPVLTISDFSFTSPPTVPPGSPIQITNADGVPHTVTATDGQFDTGEIAGGATATLTAPTAPGQYSFFCAIHPSMTGVLTVA